MKLISTYNNIILDHYHVRDNETVWLWVSPDNELIRVPKLRHRDYIMMKYKDSLS